ncbi:MAG: pilus assembly protein [Chloroflexi bacterium]|nr:pilus assembly protein [Chloroflexota bacterium]
MKSERGAVAIQIALMLPVLIIILLGGYELLKVLYLQQVLNDAAYQGARLVSMQPLANVEVDGQELEVVELAEKMIRRYVSRAAFVSPELRADPDDRRHLQVYILTSGGYCGERVEVIVAMPWIVGREWGLGVAGEWLPFLGRGGSLMGKAVGWVLCETQSDASLY